MGGKMKKPKCGNCGYRCIEDNITKEKKSHEEHAHPFRGEKIKWIA